MTVRLTVTFGFEASGNRSTRRPFSSLYSVMPSTDAPLVTPLGSAGWAARYDGAPRARRARGRESLMVTSGWSGDSYGLSIAPPAGTVGGQTVSMMVSWQMCGFWV